MGMAASQARLLTLTSRLHDVEFKAQSIESQKIALATQKDELYQNYCDALDATAIKVAFRGDGAKTNYVDANFSSLCNFDENRMMRYALRDNNTGKIIVSDETKKAYEAYGSDKYSFAWGMLGIDGFGWESTWTTQQESGMAIGYGKDRTSDNYTDMGFEYSDGSTLHMTECEADVYEQYCDTDTDLKTKYQAVLDAEDTTAKNEALTDFRDHLYKKYSADILDRMNINKEGIKGENDNNLINPELTWDDISQEFNYYINLWTAINEAGGCQALDPEYQSGEDGNKWFNNMVESGSVGIMVWNANGRNNQWSDTSVATSTSNNYLQSLQDDKDLKKAEAEYEHELDILNRKDTKFDTELSKLETERTSITTEMDAVKKVKDDNIERTFGIFS